ncbi:PH domain-containing protein [Candidatus Nitrospira allomarina]|uniref:PH domain-containing protein n=1 Tax=Candidatus Nitrospira allomarina TaxID=3020900 RepID=A0AA96G8U4_9BACT|nr:PH domain-containing protein [Candidatus Nitrospira allomarina]WNM56527.1 PH domain-containing protein [Candidatus Nitrospira allomarina]
MSEPGDPERIIWKGYPSWGHFTWLYFFSLWTGLRGFLLLRMGFPGWEMWFVGAGILLSLVVVLRYWAKYLLTSKRVVLKNGYSGKDMASVEFGMFKSVEVMQGPIARMLGIGTLVIHSENSGRSVRFRGIKDPEVIETKLRALLPPSSPVLTHNPA